MPDVGKKKKGSRRAGTVTEHRSRRVDIYFNPNKPRVSSVSDVIPHFDDDDLDDDDQSVMQADAVKATPGNPVSGFPDVAGRQVNSRELAFQHPDLRQSNTDFSEVLSRLRTARGNVVDLGVPDGTAGGFSHAGEVALHSFDAAMLAGEYRGMQAVDHDPLRPDYHPARASGTPPNGSHSTASPTCPPRVSMKNSEALEIMKRELFG
jgi:hypothetical protein